MILYPKYLNSAIPLILPVTIAMAFNTVATIVKAILLKFIDAFTISIYTAQILFKYNIHTASDPDAAAASKREEIEFDRQRAIERIRLLLKNVMSDKEGRELVFFLLDLSQCDTLSFNTNALTMAFGEGRRSYGLDLKRLIDPELYQQMLKESYERTRNKRSSRNDK